MLNTNIKQPKKRTTTRSEMYRRAVVGSFLKLNPRGMVKNPVMFVVEVGSVLTTILTVQALLGKGEAPAGFIGAVSVWLWFTVLFANFSEALAEGRGKAQAEALRRVHERLRGLAPELRRRQHLFQRHLFDGRLLARPHHKQTLYSGPQNSDQAIS